MRLTCYYCGTEFEKEDKEIRRQQRAGRSHFFYDMDNIVFSHARCNYEAGTKTFVSNYKNGVKEDMELYVY